MKPDLGTPPRPEVEVSTAHLLPPDQSPDGTFDRDINVGGIVKLFVVLAVVGALTFVVSAFLVRGYVERARQSDRPPSPLAGERRLLPSPQPRLATEPVGEIVDLRQEEFERLGSYGWTDRSLGIARLPIDRAIEILAERGGTSPFPPPAASAQTGAPAPTVVPPATGAPQP